MWPVLGDQHPDSLSSFCLVPAFYPILNCSVADPLEMAEGRFRPEEGSGSGLKTHYIEDCFILKFWLKLEEKYFKRKPFLGGL